MIYSYSAHCTYNQVFKRLSRIMHIAYHKTFFVVLKWQLLYPPPLTFSKKFLNILGYLKIYSSPKHKLILKIYTLFSTVVVAVEETIPPK